ncbi:MAG: AAA family ATPase [Clostridiales bacterium]|nr:AAA family ATPase [Clostridiales bacterium]
MGKYLNPGNNGFQAIRNGLYVDKTGLIEYINSTVNISPNRLTSFSRPRRFGKSFAAKMLCAYYDKSCDSRTLFEGLEISTKKSFETYLNKFDVIYLDITWFLSTVRDRKQIVIDLQDSVIRELRDAFSDCIDEGERSLPGALSGIAEKSGEKFIIIMV